MTNEIIEILPVPILQKNIGDILKPDEVNILKSADIIIRKNTKEIFDNESHQNIIDSFNSWFNYYAHKVMGIDKNLSIETDEVLVNKTEPESVMNMHDHQNSLLTAVYYFEDAPESAPLVFYLQQQNLFKRYDFLVRYDEDNVYNESYRVVRPKAGDIIIFPSWLNHFNPPNKSENPRYSLAAQSWIRGKIDSATKTNWERYSGAERSKDLYYVSDLKM